MTQGNTEPQAANEEGMTGGLNPAPVEQSNGQAKPAAHGAHGPEKGGRRRRKSSRKPRRKSRAAKKSRKTARKSARKSRRRRRR